MLFLNGIQYLKKKARDDMYYDTHIYRGSVDSINRHLLVTYSYDFDMSGDYPTVRKTPSGKHIISPSFSISISEGFDKDRLFLPGNKYYVFVSLLNKAIKLVSENLFEIFPNVSKTEFDIDQRALERFQTEKALSVAGMTATPSVWTNETSECFPGISIESKYGKVVIPLEDAIPLAAMLSSFDPLTYSISMLQFFGKFD